MFPKEERYLRQEFTDKNIVVDFNGNGVVVLGNVKSRCGESKSDYVALLDIMLDGQKIEQVKMPFDYIPSSASMTSIINISSRKVRIILKSYGRISILNLACI